LVVKKKREEGDLWEGEEGVLSSTTGSNYSNVTKDVRKKEEGRKTLPE